MAEKKSGDAQSIFKKKQVNIKEWIYWWNNWRPNNFKESKGSKISISNINSIAT